MTPVLRYMALDDIPQVIAIDKASFDPPWSARSYAYEVTESSYSHMVVLEENGGRNGNGLLRRLQNITGKPSEKTIAAYGGLWHIADEAHISTIASHPDLRGKGYGEIVLAGMVRRAITLHAGYIVLEVRVSNIAAQNLYKKYAFEIVDTKPRYYHNNGEDAYDMRLDLSRAGVAEQLEAHYRALKKKHPFLDKYSDSQPPRGQG